MTLRFTLALAVAAAVGAAWFLTRSVEPPQAPAPAARVAAAKPAPAAPTRLSASSVLAIDPKGNGAGAPPAVAPKATLHGEYLAARNYRALYDRLRNAPAQTPEAAYVLYEILRECATIPDRDWKSRVPRRITQKREEFLAAIPENDPNRAQRIAAFDEVAANRCAGMEDVTFTNAELAKLLTDAAAAGDPKAKATLLEHEVLQARRGNWREATLTDAQVEALRQAFGSRDPEAILVAGRIISSTWNDFSLRIGPDGAAVEPRALMNAWAIVACDYGYPCGDANQRILAACAQQGHCDAGNLPDFLFYYGGTPHDSQLLSQYRTILRQAIESGDWSQLRVVRGPTPQGSGRFYFMGRR